MSQQTATAMKLAAAQAIAGLIGAQELSPANVIPSPFDPRVVPAVAAAVADVARREGTVAT
jgi:malate dehydrogenase (oxaloacetate-decarboxylating)